LNSYDLLWQTILSDLEQTYDEDTFGEVFEPLQNIHQVLNNVIYILVPNEFIKNRIQRLYLSKIHELAQTHSGEALRFKFLLESELEPEYDIVSPDLDLENRYRLGNLNGSFRFDNFVVGKSNMFAFRMAMKVADQPGVVANPLYIFGDVGLGKTHLTQAIEM